MSDHSNDEKNKKAPPRFPERPQTPEEAAAALLWRQKVLGPGKSDSRTWLQILRNGEDPPPGTEYLFGYIVIAAFIQYMGGTWSPKDLTPEEIDTLTRMQEAARPADPMSCPVPDRQDQAPDLFNLLPRPSSAEGSQSSDPAQPAATPGSSTVAAAATSNSADAAAPSAPSATTPASSSTAPPPSPAPPSATAGSAGSSGGSSARILLKGKLPVPRPPGSR